MIPTYIMEEHNEAFYYWRYMIQQGYISPINNVLLHVDAHSDFEKSILPKNFLQQNHNLQLAYHYTYNILNIFDFILPAFILEIFNSFVWLHSPTKDEFQKNVYEIKFDKCGYTIPKSLSTEEIQEWELVHKNNTEKSVMIPYITGGLDPEGIPLIYDSIVLDIDLDYFCCDNTCRYKLIDKIEITEDEYYKIKNNIYHPVNLNEHGKYYLYREQDKYYLKIRNNPCGLKFSKEDILRHMDEFCDWLKTQNIIPKAICICRSRFSGYAPNVIFPWLEDELLNRLNKIYELNIQAQPII